MDLAYTIKTHARARGVKITIKSDGSVVVTKSRRVSDIKVKELVDAKRAWILEMQNKMHARPKKLLAHLNTVDHYKEHKEAARLFVQQKVAQWNALYNFRIGAISIRNQSTRWGSCSRVGNLNFNYKIIFLPEALADYLVVHELAHLQQMNHGPRFWALVEKAIPDYLAKRKELQRY